MNDQEQPEKTPDQIEIERLKGIVFKYEKALKQIAREDYLQGMSYASFAGAAHSLAKQALA